MKRFAMLVGIGALMFLALSSLQAQVEIVSKTSYADSKNSSTETVYVEKDRVCMESQGRKDNTVAVYRPGPLIWVMNLNEGTYMEMNAQDIEQMKAMTKKMKAQMDEQQKQVDPQMEEARKKMEEQMKNMTPEQREQMKKYMPQGMMNMISGPEKTVYKKVASGVKTGSWPCDKYEGYRGQEKVEEVWSTDFNSFGISTADLKVFEEFGKLFEGFGDEKQSAAFKIGSKEFEEEQGFPGVAVKTIKYSNGKVQSTEELVKVEKKSGFDDALFQLRPNLKKTENPMDQMKGSQMPPGMQ